MKHSNSFQSRRRFKIAVIASAVGLIMVAFQNFSVAPGEEEFGDLTSELRVRKIARMEKQQRAITIINTLLLDDE